MNRYRLTRLSEKDDATSYSSFSRIGEKYGLAAIASVVFIFDFITKWATHHFLPLIAHSSSWYPYGGIGVFRNFLGIEFSISHTTNTGAAWGMLSTFPHLLLLFRIVLLGAMIVYLCFFNKNRALQIPLTLIITGAGCNILDFFIYGHVVDMLHFVFWGYDYPVFNLADSAIFIGVFWMALLSLLQAPRKERDYGRSH